MVEVDEISLGFRTISVTELPEIVAAADPVTETETPSRMRPARALSRTNALFAVDFPFTTIGP
jgi:hypothetical protein